MGGRGWTSLLVGKDLPAPQTALVSSLQASACASHSDWSSLPGKLLFIPKAPTPKPPQFSTHSPPPHTSHPPAAFGAAGPYTCIIFTSSSGNLFNHLEWVPEVFLKMV